MVHQGEGCFTPAKAKPKKEDLSGFPRRRGSPRRSYPSSRRKKNTTKDNSRVCLGEEAFASVKDVGLEQQTLHF